jgi:hypothetical protein
MSRTVMGEFLTAASNRCRAVAQDVLQVIDASHPLRRDLRLDATTSAPANGFLGIPIGRGARGAGSNRQRRSDCPVHGDAVAKLRHAENCLVDCSGASNCPHGATPKAAVYRRDSRRHFNAREVSATKDRSQVGREIPFLACAATAHSFLFSRAIRVQNHDASKGRLVARGPSDYTFITITNGYTATEANDGSRDQRHGTGFRSGND